MTDRRGVPVYYRRRGVPYVAWFCTRERADRHLGACERLGFTVEPTPVPSVDYKDEAHRYCYDPACDECHVEPAARITRVRLRGEDTVAIRGAACEYCGPRGSHWAYIRVEGRPRTPGPDSTRQDEGGWVCWLDLDYVGVMVNDEIEVG